MPTYATAPDLAALLQQDIDRASAELALDLVEAEVLDTAPAVSTAPPPWLRGFVLRAAARLYDNPTDAESEQVGDAAVRFRAAAASGLLTAWERARLRRHAGTSSSGGRWSFPPPDPWPDTRYGAW